MSCPKTYNKCNEFMCNFNDNQICVNGRHITEELKRDINTYNRMVIKTQGYDKGVFMCTCCGENVSAYESFSTRGKNLICIKCIDKHFKNIDEARELYIDI